MEPNLAEIHVVLNKQGQVAVQFSSNNNITNFGLLEMAKIILQSNVKDVKTAEPSSIVRI